MKMPQAWVQASTKTSKVEGKINMSAEVAGQGKCPECQKPMVVAHTTVTPQWVCAACRISLPLPDTHEALAK